MNFKFFTFLILIATIFASCDKFDYSSVDLKKVENTALIGKWESISSEVIAVEDGEVIGKESSKHNDPFQKQTIIFRADKTGMDKSYNEDTEIWDENEFTYTIVGDKIVIRYLDELGTGIAGLFGVDLENFEMKYSISGNTLTTYFEIEFIGTVKITTLYTKK